MNIHVVADQFDVGIAQSVQLRVHLHAVVVFAVAVECTVGHGVHVVFRIGYGCRIVTRQIRAPSLMLL